MTKQKNTHQLLVSASTEHLSEVREFVAAHALNNGFSEEEIQDIRLAVDEAYTNIIKHAYKYDDSQKVEITLGANGDAFWISLFDDGNAFDTSKYKEPNIRNQIRNKKRGGVGVYLIKQLMDKVEYHTEGRRNEIRMVKEK